MHTRERGEAERERVTVPVMELSHAVNLFALILHPVRTLGMCLLYKLLGLGLGPWSAMQDLIGFFYIGFNQCTT